ncbi:MAG: anti-sigma factor domain-containing protein [Actinomycetota bacterium]
MSNEHERIEELLSVRALGGMEAPELAEYARIRTDHGDCEICLRAELEFDEIAGRLAFALEPVELPAGMEDTLLRRATSERPADDEVAARRRAPRGERVARPGRTARTAVAVAAALALVAGAFAGGYFAHGGAKVPPQEQALSAYLVHPDVHLVQFHGKAGNLAVAFRPGLHQAFVFGANLRGVPSGKQYEVWLFPPGGGAPARGPTFNPPAPGSVVVVPVSADPSRSVLMAVTVERAGGVDAPTSNPVLTAPIKSA